MPVSRTVGGVLLPVVGCGDGDEVPGLIVRSVVVEMMDVVLARDRAIGLLEDDPVQQPSSGVTPVAVLCFVPVGAIPSNASGHTNTLLATPNVCHDSPAHT
jgi:hypothetical protein